MFKNFPAGRGQLPRVLSNDDGEEMMEPLYGNRCLQFFVPHGVNRYAPLQIRDYEDVMQNRFAPALESGCDGWSICYNFGAMLWEPPENDLPGVPADPLKALEKRWHSGKERQFFLSMRVNDLHHRYYNRPRFWTEERIANRKFFQGPLSEEYWKKILVPWIKSGKIPPVKVTENGLLWVTHHYELEEHPELAKTALSYDFTHPEVRELNLRHLAEAFEHCDADGVELDFLRFWWLFPEGKTRPELVTAWIAQVRALVDRQAEKAGHPVKLIARVLENPEEQQAMGHDVEEWLKRGFFDAVIIGRGFLYSHPCIKNSIDLAHKYNCPVYGAFDSGHFCGTRFRTPQAMRAAISALYSQSVEGIYFFNHYAPSEYYLFDDAAEPEQLAKRPKEYFVDTGYLHDWPWNSGGLPAVLEKGEGEFLLYFADEPSRAERLQIDYDTAVPFPISVKINGRKITLRNTPGQAASRSSQELADALVCGHNRIELKFPAGNVNIAGIGISSN
ncbi:MAG: hypothetical protein IJW17_08835 [Lentisphaeria bacterium]|nr:hypothetical protein [Lentisphaeria bacterium]